MSLTSPTAANHAELAKGPNGGALAQELALQRVIADIAPAHARPVCLGRYRVHDVIGAGGFGRVFRGRDDALDRDVAVKLVRLSGSQQIELCRGEAQMLARFSHPNVVAVFDVFTETVDGATQLAIVMELLEGQTLADWCRDPARTRDEIIDAYLDLSRAVQALHRNDIVHRDVKPTNVMRNRDGRVVLLDLGIAVIDDAVRTFREDAGIRSGVAIAGTPRYMPPEHLRGDASPDASMDVYAFCASMLESLRGSPVFSGSAEELLRQKRRGAPGNPRDEPDELAAVLVRGLAPSPEQRWSTVREVRRAIQRARRGGSLAPSIGVVTLVGGLICAMVPTNAPEATEPCVAFAPGNEVAAVEFVPEREGYVQRRAPVAEACGRLRGPTRALANACLQRVDARARRQLADTSKNAALLDVDACRAPRLAGLAPLPTDPQERSKILELQLRLDDWGEESSSVYPQRDALLREIKGLGYEPLLARAYLTVGRAIAAHEVQFEGPAEMFESAYLTGLRSGDDQTAMEAAMARTAYAQWLGEAKHWAENTFAMARRRSSEGNEPANILSMVLVNLVHHTKTAGDVELAYAYADRSVELAERCPSSFCSIKALTSRGSLGIQASRLDEALADLEVADELARRDSGGGLVGADAALAARRELARVYRALGRIEEAEGIFVAIVASPKTSPLERRTSWAELCRTIGISDPLRVFDGLACFDRWEHELASQDALLVGDRARVELHRGLLFESAGLRREALKAYRAATTRAEVDDLGPEHQVTRAAVENYDRLSATEDGG